MDWRIGLKVKEKVQTNEKRLGSILNNIECRKIEEWRMHRKKENAIEECIIKKKRIQNDKVRWKETQIVESEEENSKMEKMKKQQQQHRNSWRNDKTNELKKKQKRKINAKKRGWIFNNISIMKKVKKDKEFKRCTEGEKEKKEKKKQNKKKK